MTWRRWAARLLRTCGPCRGIRGLTIAPKIDAAPGPATGKRGSVTLARHGEPALSRAVRLNAREYRAWWGVYEEGGILEGQTPPETIIEVAKDSDRLFASTRKRALQTADLVAGGKPVTADEVFIEAPLPPPWIPGFIRLNPRIWGFIARFCWWFFNNHVGEESRAQATVRAQAATRMLTDEAQKGQDVLLLAHGFFNRMIEIELKRLGWRRVAGKGYAYWSAKRFEKT